MLSCHSLVPIFPLFHLFFQHFALCFYQRIFPEKLLAISAHPYPHPSLHQTFLFPCGRQNKKRKIEAIIFLNKNSSLVFPPISFKLARPTTHPNQCVIRWFSCLSLRANLGCEILITVNGHYISLRYAYMAFQYTHVANSNQMMSYRKAYNEIGSITFP